MFAVVLVCLLLGGSTHVINEFIEDSVQITAFVNQSKPIDISFKMCFQAETELPANAPLIAFTPTTLQLSLLKQVSLQQTASSPTTLEDLRSESIFKHRSIIIFDTYLLVFAAPNTILILQELEKEFKVINSYKVSQITPFSRVRLYKFNENAALHILDSTSFLLLNSKDYEVYTLPELTALTHLEVVPNTLEFYGCEIEKGLTHYQLLPSKNIAVLRRYKGMEYGIKDNTSPYPLDFTLQYLSNKVIYILDEQIGLIRMSLQQPVSAEVVIHQKYCVSFESMQEDHFVLVCHGVAHSMIIEAYREGSSFKKLEPLFHRSYINELHVAEKFYIGSSQKALKVFWNTRKNNLPETINTQTDLYLPGLEVFTLLRVKDSSLLYTVENGLLRKYALLEKLPLLLVHSSEPIVKIFNLHIYGSCSDLAVQKEGGRQGGGQGGRQVKTCKVIKNVFLKVLEQDYPRQEDFSISASIIVILIIVFLLVIWICLKKYKGLEREARRVLENYQKKKTRRRRAI